MSSSAVALGPEPRNTPVARVPRKQIQNLSKDHFFHLFSFLSPVELALAERVGKTWCTMIGAEDQRLWKGQCHAWGATVVSPYVQQALDAYTSVDVSGQHGESRFDVNILSLITEYGADYKAHAIAFQGRIEFYRDSWQMDA